MSLLGKVIIEGDGWKPIEPGTYLAEFVGLEHDFSKFGKLPAIKPQFKVLDEKYLGIHVNGFVNLRATNKRGTSKMGQLLAALLGSAPSDGEYDWDALIGRQCFIKVQLGRNEKGNPTNGIETYERIK